MNDDELLQLFLASGPDCERAFSVLVDRYAGLVFTIARRRVGNHEAAEEIAQNVFTILARKARRIRAEAGLASWLHRATMLEAAKHLRTEYRRNRKMDELSKLPAANAGSEPRWDEILPGLDEVLHKLNGRERDVILRKYFQGQTYAEIARETNRTEAACAKQCSRGLEKLCGLLKREGIVLSAATLCAGIAKHYASAAPAGLAQSLSQVALSGTACAASSSTTSALTTIMTTKITATAVCIVAGAAVPLSFHWSNAARAHNTSMTPSGSTPLPSTASSEPTTNHAGKKAELPGIDLALLERELKRLPLARNNAERKLQLEALMFELRDEDIPHVLTLLKNIGKPEQVGSIARSLFARWAESDPRGAALAAENLQDYGLEYWAREGAMVTWAAVDFKEALAYLEEHPNGKKESSMVWAVIDGMVKRDPIEALERGVARLADPDVKAQVTKTILQAWGELDSKKALEWIGELEDEKQRESLTKSVIDRLAAVDPAESLRLALNHDNPRSREELASWAFRQWAHQDETAAAQAYANLPESLRTYELTRHAALGIAEANPETALWIANQLPEGKVRDQWIYGAAFHKADTAPLEAIPLAESLPKGWQRRNALRHIASRWLYEDRDAATAWIEESGHFKDEDRAKLFAK